MFNYWKRNKSFAIFKGFLSAALLIGATAQATTYPANSTNNCTGPKNCTLESWGIDLNDNTGYSWQVSSAQASAANVYVKVASLSGTRSMSLWVNNTKVATLSTNSTTAPRPTGAELSAVSVQLISGANTIELRDTENTTEFDVHHLRVETVSSSSSSSSLSSSSSSAVPPTLTLSITNNSGRAYKNETVNLAAAMSSGSGWQYAWKLIQDPTYNRKDIYDLVWSSTWDSRCQAPAFGQRITAKLYPPTTGQYKFAVAADDRHELYLTQNGTKQLLTSSTTAVAPTNINNQSQLVTLNANTAYAFEFLYINQAGDGHFSILWQKPGSNQWEEIPEELFSKPDQSVATGKLLQETFNNTLSSMSQLKSLASFVNSRSNTNNSVLTGSSITFTPDQHKTYTFEVTATSGSQSVTNYVSFYAEGKFVSEDLSNAGDVWQKIASDPNQLSITTVSDGTASGKVMQITAPPGGTFAKWSQTVYLEPYTAYEVRARVRLLNPQHDMVVPVDWKDSAAWQLPRLRVGVHGDASQQGINATSPTAWRDIAVDFIVPFDGAVDINLEMEKRINNNSFLSYSGTFQVDNLRIEKLSGNGVTRFDFPNLAANIYNDFVTKTGGYEATRNYIQRLSQSAESMRKLSGKNFMVQCRKENIFIPRQWHVFAYGTNNGMILKTSELLTDDFLEDVWGSSDIVGGTMVHELEHSFDFDNSSFESHLPLFLQVHAMEEGGFKRTHNNSFLTAAEWIQDERIRVPASACGWEPHHLLPKLFQFQDTYLTSNRWSVIQQIMHDRWSPYKISQGHQWAAHGDYFGQYRKWWEEIYAYTGLDGWTLVHTATERQEIERALTRLANPAHPTIDPLNVPNNPNSFYLYRAAPASEPSIGWGTMDVNNLVEVSGSCREQNIYAHAPSSITYNLGKTWLAFDTRAVIKNNSANGLVSARIKGDGVVLYQSSNFTAQSGPVNSGVLDVSNVNQLTLEFLDVGSADSDWSVWVDPLLTKGFNAATKFASTGKAIKHSDGKCIAPEFGGAPAMNEKAVFSNDCTSSNSKFKWLASGALMHINSGACLHPLGGSSTPSNGTYLVFFPNCDNHGHIQYDPTSQNSIKHRTSTSCIHPEGGSGTPSAGTKLVFDQGCDETRLSFTLQ